MPTDFDLVPVDHDPFDPTGLIGPTQQLGQPSVFQAFMNWRNSGQSWTDKLQAAEGNPQEQMRLLSGIGVAGMARPVTPSGFAENLAKMLKETDLSGTEIAKALGVGRATVQRNIAKLGLERRPTSVEAGVWSDPDNVETLRRMHELGASDEEISRNIGIARSSVSNKRASLGLERNFEPGQRANIATTRRWEGRAEGFAIPVSGKKPTLPQSNVPDPGASGDSWLMQQLGYDPDFTVRPVDHDPFKK